MENITNPIIETPIIIEKPKTNYLNIFLISFAFILFSSGVYLLGKQSVVIPSNTPVTVLPQTTPVPIKEAINPTANWKTYSSEVCGISFLYPNSWSVEENSTYLRVRQIIEEGTFIVGVDFKKTNLSISELISNFKKEDSAFVQMNPNLKSEKIVINSFNAEKIEYVDATGLKNISIIITNGTNKVLVEYRLLSNDTIDQILSTFKFTESNVVSPTKIQTSIKSIKYTLPQNWLSVRDNSQFFEVGYNPAIQDINTGSQSVAIKSKNLNNDPYYSPYASTKLFQILPYNNGSRHVFIEKQLGEALSADNKSANYIESEMNIDGKNCLILNGIAISQSYTVWGMCPINNGQALLFTSFNYADLSQHLSSIKFNL